MKNTSSDFDWSVLATDPLISILNYLNGKDLENVSYVCRNWHDVSCLDIIWRRRFRLDFQIQDNMTLPEYSTSWIKEYMRVTESIPSVEYKTIKVHSDEVLHVSFSNNGRMFGTCSKDATVKVFHARSPYDIILDKNLGFATEHRWIYTQCSEFNSSDTLLLVSGRCPGMDWIGEIIILDLLDNFSVRSVAKINYFDAMGAWLNETCYLSQHAYHDQQSSISLYMVKATDVIQGTEFTPCVFSCVTCCYYRTADITKYVGRDEGACMWKINDVNEHNEHSAAGSLVKEELKEQIDKNEMPPRKKPKNFANTDSESVKSYLLLLCFTGYVMDFPHRLGIKRIVQKPTSKFPVTKYFTRSCKPQKFPLEQAFLTEFDYFIDLDGIALGMTVSPCNRYVFANVRKSLIDIDQVRTNHLQLASNVVLHQYDLLTLKEVKCFTGHKGLSSKTVSLLAVSCTERYVTSGSEDKKGYLWDRHHGILLSIFSHNGIVNSVALNPCQRGMAISCGDDHIIRIWHSKSICENYDTPLLAP